MTGSIHTRPRLNNRHPALGQRPLALDSAGGGAYSSHDVTSHRAGAHRQVLRAWSDDMREIRTRMALWRLLGAVLLSNLALLIPAAADDFFLRTAGPAGGPMGDLACI